MQPLKITELPFFIGGSDQVSNLNIELFISTVADKINFGVVQLADLNFIAALCETGKQVLGFLFKSLDL